MGLRAFAEGDYFAGEAKKIFGSSKLADEALEPVYYAISRVPNLAIFPAVGDVLGSPLRAIKLDQTKAGHGVVVYFTVAADGERAILHSVIRPMPSV